jgi:uncharacterized protein (TIGR03435 family)
MSTTLRKRRKELHGLCCWRGLCMQWCWTIHLLGVQLANTDRTEGSRIMRLAERTYLRRMCLYVAIFFAAASGGLHGQAAFEVSSVKLHDPNELSQPRRIDPAQARFIGHSLLSMIMFAYNVKVHQVERGPDWLGTERYDVIAKLKPGSDLAQVPALLQNLLAERFGLKVSWQTREVGAYAMVVGPSGLSLKRSAPYTPKIVQYSTAGYIVLRGATMDDICDLLAARVFDRPVVNRTEISGSFDLELRILPANLSGGTGIDAADNLAPQDQSIADTFEKFGLKFQKTRASMRYLIIDQIRRKPTSN